MLSITFYIKFLYENWVLHTSTYTPQPEKSCSPLKELRLDVFRKKLKIRECKNNFVSNCSWYTSSFHTIVMWFFMRNLSKVTVIFHQKNSVTTEHPCEQCKQSVISVFLMIRAWGNDKWRESLIAILWIFRIKTEIYDHIRSNLLFQ